MIPLLDACQHPPWTAQLSPRQGRQGTCSSRASASATLKEPWNSLLEAMNGTNAPHALNALNALNALITHSLHRLPSSTPGWTFKASRTEPMRKPPVGSKFAMWTLRSDEIFDSNRSGENVRRKITWNVNQFILTLKTHEAIGDCKSSNFTNLTC